MLPELVNMTDESTVLEHTLHVRPPDSLARGCWGEGRVTLAGDAAHPLRPASGESTLPVLKAARIDKNRNGSRDMNVTLHALPHIEMWV